MANWSRLEASNRPRSDISRRCYSREIPKILIWAHLELLEACRGQTKQTMVGIKVVYGILEQVGSFQQAQKGCMVMLSLSGSFKNTEFGTFGALEAKQNRH